MSLQWLKPKGFWGFIGLMGTLTVPALIAVQMIWQPLLFITHEQAFEIGTLLMMCGING